MHSMVKCIRVNDNDTLVSGLFPFAVYKLMSGTEIVGLRVACFQNNAPSYDSAVNFLTQTKHKNSFCYANVKSCCDFYINYKIQPVFVDLRVRDINSATQELKIPLDMLYEMSDFRCKSIQAQEFAKAIYGCLNMPLLYTELHKEDMDTFKGVVKKLYPTLIYNPVYLLGNRVTVDTVGNLLYLYVDTVLSCVVRKDWLLDCSLNSIKEENGLIILESIESIGLLISGKYRHITVDIGFSLRIDTITGYCKVYVAKLNKDRTKFMSNTLVYNSTYQALKSCGEKQCFSVYGVKRGV